MKWMDCWKGHKFDLFITFEISIVLLTEPKKINIKRRDKTKKAGLLLLDRLSGWLSAHYEWFLNGAPGLMDDASLEARYSWCSKPVRGAKDSFGWWKIERALAVVAAHLQLHRPPAAKFDLVQGNIFSQSPCLQFKRPGHMLWNEVGRQTKRLVICPHCVAIDWLLLAVGFLERTASTEKETGQRRVGGTGLFIRKKRPEARPPMRLSRCRLPPLWSRVNTFVMPSTIKQLEASNLRTFIEDVLLL